MCIRDRTISEQLETLMEQRRIWRQESAGAPIPVCAGDGTYRAAVAAPILCAGDVLGLVLFLSDTDAVPGEAEEKLAQTVAAFLGKNMES